MDVLLAMLSLAVPATSPQLPLGSSESIANSLEPHNVVLFLADDVGVDMIGAYDSFYDVHPDPNYPNTTPAIDYLAQTGLLFRNAWTSPVCSPTRAQILTGKHGFRSGIGWVVPPGTPGAGLQGFHDTIPSMLRSGPSPPAYHTAALGKWHLASGSQHPPPLGGPVHPNGNPIPWFHQYAGPIANLGSQDYNLWTKTFGTPIAAHLDECPPSPMSYCEAAVSDYATVDTADDAIHLIRTMPEPFYLYVAFNSAHTPLDEPDRPLTAASCGGVSGQVTCDFTGDVPSQARCMVQWMDNEIGRILCAIESDPDKPTRPTTIIFMGDNGTTPEATVAPFIPSHAKATIYEGGVNVPFIVKSPLVWAGLVGSSTDALVSSTDLFATISQITHKPQPPDPYGLRDSTSLLPVLLGTAMTTRQTVYAERFLGNFVPTALGTPPPGYTLDRHSRAIRNVAGFKLHQGVSRDGVGGFVLSEELYDLPNDNHEVANRLADALTGVEPYASNYTQLRAELNTNFPHLVTP